MVYIRNAYFIIYNAFDWESPIENSYFNKNMLDLFSSLVFLYTLSIIAFQFIIFFCFDFTPSFSSLCIYGLFLRFIILFLLRFYAFIPFCLDFMPLFHSFTGYLYYQDVSHLILLPIRSNSSP